MKAEIVLQDGFRCEGEHFGAPVSVAGEVVFNTGMVGYPESMTDPSYAGQILVLTYPLIGNYGIPVNGDVPDRSLAPPLSPHFESGRIHIRALVISRLSDQYSHWSARSSLESWMARNNVPGVCGVDTRALTKRLRTEGCLLGKLLVRNEDLAWDDPNERNIVAEVSAGQPELFRGTGDKRVILVDMGSKDNIARSLLSRGLTVLKVPWDYDWSHEEADGVVISNGPGDPKRCTKTIQVIRKGFDRDIPLFGICLGHQLIALAAGGDTYKLRFGHRGQNQPCIEVGSKRCFITSQNHGFAVDERSLPEDWVPWFFNANDGTNEGIRHRTRPISSVQFHPEARPGPSDTDHLFDNFVDSLNHAVISA
ncbi:MAG: glutamine-hydrolyzing carbamoyl-phosphate synthase small subunit [Bacteroidota bacterium]